MTKLLEGLQVEYLPVGALVPRARNARLHPKEQIRELARIIENTGVITPILVDENNIIAAGHGRLAAAKLLGRDKVPVIRLSGLAPAQIRAFVLADNKIAEKAGWDQGMLTIEFEALSIELPGLDLTLTGFETAEIDLALAGPAQKAITEKPVPPVASGPAVSQPGDVWLLGEHRLLCGDATDAGAYESVMDGQRAQMVFTDPPYNVPIDGHVSGNGQVKHAEFAMASGEMDEAAFTDFLRTVFAHLAANSTDGSMHFVAMDWRHMYEVLQAGRAAYAEMKNLCVWNKTNGGMGSLYRSKHELFFVFKQGKAAHVNNVSLGRHGRNRSNVWDYAGANTFRKGRAKDLADHPTVKPVDLVADAILDCSTRNGIVLDPFCGSGTTLLAAEKTGRRAFAIELEPKYVDVAIRRWQEATGYRAMLEGLGDTFETLEAAQKKEIANG